MEVRRGNRLIPFLRTQLSLSTSPQAFKDKVQAWDLKNEDGYERKKILSAYNMPNIRDFTVNKTGVVRGLPDHAFHGRTDNKQMNIVSDRCLKE